MSSEKTEIRLSANELCVMASLSGMKCLYGVSQQWLSEKMMPLNRQIRDTITLLSERNLMFIELDGNVIVPDSLGNILKVISDAYRIGRWSLPHKNYSKQIYFYYSDEGIVYIMQDNYGEYILDYLDVTKSASKALSEFLINYVGLNSDVKWVTGLVFEKKQASNVEYQVIKDVVWEKDNGNLMEIYTEFCQCICGDFCKEGFNI